MNQPVLVSGGPLARVEQAIATRRYLLVCYFMKRVVVRMAGHSTRDDEAYPHHGALKFEASYGSLWNCSINGIRFACYYLMLDVCLHGRNSVAGQSPSLIHYQYSKGTYSALHGVIVSVIVTACSPTMMPANPQDVVHRSTRNKGTVEGRLVKGMAA